ncbi:MAG: efflux RND transporter permease subunit, partial [Deltaproteobacteria bacterium]|nr:efflux RND transporter permease subunit [Deltaproteobacteria bacterium]
RAQHGSRRRRGRVSAQHDLARSHSQPIDGQEQRAEGLREAVHEAAQRADRAFGAFGQVESERSASRTIGFLGVFVVAGIFLLLFLSFRSTRNALLIMVNLPLALIGGVVAVFFGSGVLSIASLVGFITLFGIATRNGIMMVSHYEHLRTHEGASFDEAVVRGSIERLSPVLMTALCAGLALIPLVIAGGETGNELQAPMGVVILGGLLSATALNMLVVPALYARFARPRTDLAATREPV